MKKQPMKFLDVVHLVLSESKRPLRPEDIATKMLAQGLWELKGKTPAATVGARLAEDIKKNGSLSRFARSKPGYFIVNPKDALNNDHRVD